LGEFGFARLPPEHGELMAKGHILQEEQALGLAARNQGPEQNQDDIRHSELSFEQASVSAAFEFLDSTR